MQSEPWWPAPFRVRCRVLFAAWLATLLGFVAPLSSGAADFCFTPIADTRSAFTSFSSSSYSLNDSGVVAFAGFPSGGGAGVYTGDGGALTQIADTSGPLDQIMEHTVVNASGRVAFKAFLDAGGMQILTGDGGALTVVAEAPGSLFDAINLRFSLNAAGVVAHKGTLTAGGKVIAIGDGGTASVLYDDTGVLASFQRPDINDTDEVAFCATLAGGSPAIVRGDGGPLTHIADTTGGVYADFSTSSCASLNASGDVAFQASLVGGGEAIFVGDGVAAPVTIADTSGSFQHVDDASLNDSLDVAFFAELGPGNEGIFLGPDPIADAVIRSGDALDGSSVKSLRFTRDGLNSLGQVAFYATLADGARGFHVATPGTGCGTPLPACSDGSDNDGDLLIDYPDDPGCFTPNGDLENPVCTDGLDNDGDGFTDYPDDPQCTSPFGTFEKVSGGKKCGLGAELVVGLLLLLPAMRDRARR